MGSANVNLRRLSLLLCDFCEIDAAALMRTIMSGMVRLKMILMQHQVANDRFHFCQNHLSSFHYIILYSFRISSSLAVPFKAIGALRPRFTVVNERAMKLFHLSADGRRRARKFATKLNPVDPGQR